MKRLTGNIIAAIAAVTIGATSLSAQERQSVDGDLTVYMPPSCM